MVVDKLHPVTEFTVPRRQRLPRAQRRSLLLKAATLVFAAEGYHHASMEAMAKAAGVTKPVLYQHFASKLDLLRAVVQQSTDDLAHAITESLHGDDHAIPFANAVSALYDFAEDNSDQFLLVFETELPQDPDVQRTILEGTARVVTAGIPVIQQRMHIDSDAATQLAWALVGMTTFAVRHWKRTDEPLPKATAVDLVVGLVTSGLSKWAPRG